MFATWNLENCEAQQSRAIRDPSLCDFICARDHTPWANLLMLRLAQIHTRHGTQLVASLRVLYRCHEPFALHLKLYMGKSMLRRSAVASTSATKMHYAKNKQKKMYVRYLELREIGKHSSLARSGIHHRVTSYARGTTRPGPTS